MSTKRRYAYVVVVTNVKFVSAACTDKAGWPRSGEYTHPAAVERKQTELRANTIQRDPNKISQIYRSGAARTDETSVDGILR